jgi:hypothetical protein
LLPEGFRGNPTDRNFIESFHEELAPNHPRRRTYPGVQVHCKATSLRLPRLQKSTAGHIMRAPTIWTPNLTNERQRTSSARAPTQMIGARSYGILKITVGRLERDRCRRSDRNYNTGTTGGATVEEGTRGKTYVAAFEEPRQFRPQPRATQKWRETFSADCCSSTIQLGPGGNSPNQVV